MGTCNDDSTRGCRECLQKPGHLLISGLGGGAGNPNEGLSPFPSLPGQLTDPLGRGRGGGIGIGGLEGFLEGEVQMNRPRRGPLGLGHSSAGLGPKVFQIPVSQLWRRDLHEHPREAPEKVELVNGLVPIGIPKAMGTIGGEDQEGDLTLGSLDDRGV